MAEAPRTTTATTEQELRVVTTMRLTADLVISLPARVAFGVVGIALGASTALGQVQQAAPPTPTSYSPATLPGKGLAQHPFLYAGESDYRKPEQTMFIVRDGRVQWTYSIPIRAADSTLQEWGDATLRSDGNIVFSRKNGRRDRDARQAAHLELRRAEGHRGARGATRSGSTG